MLQQSAALCVFGITELLEKVLLKLDCVTGKYHALNRRIFALQRVNRQFRDTIVGSQALQKQSCHHELRLASLHGRFPAARWACCLANAQVRLRLLWLSR